MNYIRKINEHPVLYSIVFNALLLIAYILSGTVKYEVSDDFIMQMTVSGGYGSPSPYIIFMSPIVGQLLCFLFNVSKELNWYILFQILIIFLSLSYILYCMLVKRSTISNFLGVTFILFFSADLYQLMQFTKTASIALVAAVFAGFQIIFEGKSRDTIFLILFAVCGLLIRLSSFFVVIPLSSIAFIFIGLTKRNSIFLKKILIFCVTMLGLYTGTMVCNKYIQNNDNQINDYNIIHSNRAKIIDYEYVPFDAIQEELESIGVSRTDYDSLWDWTFSDPMVFNQNSFEEIQLILQNYRAVHKPSIKSILKTLLTKKMWLYVSFWFCAICLVFLFVFDKSTIWIGLILGVITLALMMTHVYIGRLVYRVEFSYFLCYGSLLMLLLNSKNDLNSLNSHKITLILRVFIIVLFMFKFISLLPSMPVDRYYIMYESWNNDLRKYRLKFNDRDLPELIDYFENNCDNTYYFDFNTGIQTYYLAFDPISSSTEYFENVQYLCGVDYLNPARNEWAKRRALTGTIQDLLKDGVYLVDSHDSLMSEIYLRERYGENIKSRFVDEIGGFKIWKITR